MGSGTTRALVALQLIIFALLVAQAHAQVIVNDAIGQAISLEGPPSRVVVLSPAITEMLAYLEELDKVVGADSQSLNTVWYKDASLILRERGAIDLGGYWWSAINVEKILEINPDLILADRGAHLPLKGVFNEYNLTVVYLKGGSSSSVNDIYSDLSILASIFGKESFVIKMTEEADRAFREAQLKARGEGPSRVLVVVGIYNGIWVAGKGTFIDDLIFRSGLDNAARVYSWAPVSIEDIIEWDPDVVLVTPTGVDWKLIEQSGLAGVRGKVYLLNETEADIISRPGPLVTLAPLVLHKYLQAQPEQTPSTASPGETQRPGGEFSLPVIIIVAALSFLAGVLIGGFYRKWA